MLSPITVAAVAAGAQQPEYRDVLATAFDAPFQTTADVEMYYSNTRGRILVGENPSVQIRHPYRSLVEIDGETAQASRITDFISLVQLEPGPHSVRLVPGPPAPHPDPPPVPRPGAVGTPEELEAALADAKPGETIPVGTGIYADWHIDVSASGSPEQPIIIEPERPGSVTFRRDSMIRLSGSYIVLKGFRFDHCGPGLVVAITGDDNRVTQCQFSQCGNPQSTFSHICGVDMGADRNRVDHCYFTGSKSMSLAQRIRAGAPVGKGNHFQGNIFRDIYRYWINGQENIQLGQNQRGESGQQAPECLIEGNLFDHAWGDGEILSNKSSRNTYRHNLAAHCIRSAFTIRGADYVTFEENVMINNRTGLRVMGKRHTIRNNLIVDQIDSGIVLETGNVDGELQVATEGTLVAGNTIVNCPGGGVRGQPTSEGRPHAPTGNTFEKNVIVGRAGKLLDTQYFINSTVSGNVFWSADALDVGELNGAARWADPGLKGTDISLHAAARDDVGAPPMTDVAEFPDMPLEPIVAPELYMGDVIHAQTAGDVLALDSESAEVGVELPTDCVIAWDYHPLAYASRGELSFSGYMLSWGGVDDEGRPIGVIELRHSGDDAVIADAADVVLYCQDFRHQGWLDKTLNDSPDPSDGLWYRFTLLKERQRMVLLLGSPRLGGESIPVLTFEDHRMPSTDTQLHLVQAGTGRWRNLVVWQHQHAGDEPPPVPVALTATSFGGGRIALTWSDVRTGRAENTYEVYRSTGPDFEPSDDTLIATAIGNTHFDDFSIEPDTEHAYKVRAVNRLGLASDYANTRATSGTGGPTYTLIDASEASAIEAPMEIVPDDDRPYLWAPNGAGRFLEEPPEAGEAEYRFTVEEAGTYSVWGLVIALDKSTDSFYITTELPGDDGFATWSVPLNFAWGWCQAPGEFDFAAGEHSVRLKPRESGTKLAALLITGDMQFVPGGRE